MITEDYVSFEIAKLLKEKGFDDFTCHSYFYKNGDIEEETRYEGDFGRPTLQMAMKWLRDVHNIDINIKAECGMLGIKVYTPCIITYTRMDKLHAEDNMTRWRMHEHFFRYQNDTGVIPAIRYFDTYEEAVNAAIKYCLEKLV